MLMINSKLNKIKLAKELLDIMGTRDKYVSLTSFLKIKPEAKELVLKETKASVDEIVNLTASVYADSFSIRDLKGLLKFYKSRVGKKYLKIIIAMQPTMDKMGSDWVSSVVQKSENKYQENYLRLKAEKGIDPADYLPPLGINPRGL